MLLRLVVAGTLPYILPAPAPTWQYSGLCVLAISLLAGFLVRYTAAFCAALMLLLAVGAAGPPSVIAALHGLTAVALSMLGPGGYSIDSYLFGHRVIKLDD